MIPATIKYPGMSYGTTFEFIVWKTNQASVA